MSKSITLKEDMDLENFDPMSIDVSEFQELSKQLPIDNSNLDLVIAEHLAVIFLRAADRCSEIHSTLLWYVQKLKLDRNTTRQRLYLLAKDVGHKTIDDKCAYAESHPSFISICDRLVQGEAVKKWFEDKHKWFLESHRFMKAKLKSESEHMLSSGFSETSSVNKDGSYGEKEW